MRSQMTPTHTTQRRVWRPLSLGLVPAALLLVLAGPAAALSFAPAAHHFPGRGPGAIAVGDLNGDGRPDVVTANALGDTVGVLLGNGRGGFATRAAFATGEGPVSVAVGDFNGDGRQDLVTANRDADTVSVLLGDGHGGFRARTDFIVGASPTAVAVGDFNADEKLDLVTSNADWSDGAANVLLGDGAGGFAPRIEVPTRPASYDIGTGDFNGDGRLDLATIATDDFDGLAGVLLGDGAGHFATMSTANTYLEPGALAVGDLNADGKPDLVTAETLEGTGNLDVFLGDGGGDFSTRRGRRIAREITCVALGDVNGDRRQDVVTAAGSSVLVLRGDGHGGLAKALAFPIGSRAEDAAVADLNRDGLQDLVTADYLDNSLTVLLNGPHAAPVLGGLSPVRGRAGDVITLSGAHFGARRGAGVVSFGNVGVTDYVSWGARQIKVTVPAGGTGRIKVTVRTVSGRSAAVYFRRL